MVWLYVVLALAVGVTAGVLVARRRRRPVRIWLPILPTVVTKGGTIMATNYELPVDETVYFPILCQDKAGNIVPAPPGDIFTPASSNPGALSAALSNMPPGAPLAGAPAILCTPLNGPTAGITVSCSDSMGLTPGSQIVDVVAGAPASIEIDTADAFQVAQSPPAQAKPAPTAAHD